MPPAEVVTAIAPPARQTKSAECAPTTSRRRLTSRPPAAGTVRRPSRGPRPRRTPRRAGGRPRARARPRPRGSPGCRSRWRSSCAPSVARTPSKTCSKVVLPLCGVLRQRSSRQPFCGEGDLLLDREVLRRELGMRDDDRLHSLLERPVDDREDVLAAEVSGGEDQPVARDRPEHRPRLREQRAVLRPHEHGLDRETEAAQLVLELGPERHLVAGLRLGPARRLCRRVDRRQPDDLRALARRDLDRKRVHPADRPVQRDRPDRTHARARARRRLCARSAVEV